MIGFRDQSQSARRQKRKAEVLCHDVVVANTLSVRDRMDCELDAGTRPIKLAFGRREQSSAYRVNVFLHEGRENDDVSNEDSPRVCRRTM